MDLNIKSTFLILSILCILFFGIGMASAEDINSDEILLNDDFNDFHLDDSLNNNLNDTDDIYSELNSDDSDAYLDSNFDINSFNSDYTKNINVNNEKIVSSSNQDKSDKHVIVSFDLNNDFDKLYEGDKISFGIFLDDDEGNSVIDNVTLQLYDNDNVLVLEKTFLVDGTDPYFYINNTLAAGNYSANLILESYIDCTFKYDLPNFEIFSRTVYVKFLNEGILEDDYFILGNEGNYLIFDIVNGDGEIQLVETIAEGINGIYSLDKCPEFYHNHFYVDIGNLDSIHKGMNNITIYYPGDYSSGELLYEFSNNTLILYAYENKSNIELVSNDIVIGDDAFINASLLDDDGNLINKAFTVEVFDVTDDYSPIGVFNVTANQTVSIDKKYLIQDHAYYINASYNGDADYHYSPAHSFAYFTVMPKTTSINLNKTIFNDGDDILLQFSLVDALNRDISGSLNFTLNNKSYDVQVNNVTKGIINIGKLKFGNYTIMANFNGIDDYYPSSLNENISVLKSAKLLIETDDVPAGQSATINFSLKATDDIGTNGTLLLYISNAYGDMIVDGDSLNITNGKVNYKLENISENYFIHAVCNLDDDFESPVAYGFIKVVENKIPLVNATIDLETDENYSDVIVSLKDLDGSAITSAKINANIGGINKTLTTDANGQAKIPLNGTITIIVSYTDDANLTSYNKIVFVDNIREKNNTISKRVSSLIDYKDMVTTAITKSNNRDGDYFVLSLKDENGKPLANKDIKIGFNGKIYNRTTDKNGSAKLQINLVKVDIYTFAICFLGDDDYNASFAVAKITVNPQKAILKTSSKTYKASAKTKSISATLRDSKNRLVSGKVITFVVNGKTYAAKTNSKGIASVNVSISKKGTYSFTAKIENDLTFKNTISKNKLYIK